MSRNRMRDLVRAACALAAALLLAAAAAMPALADEGSASGAQAQAADAGSGAEAAADAGGQAGSSEDPAEAGNASVAADDSSGAGNSAGASGDAAGSDAADGASSDDAAGAPAPLDAEGNAVNEGQTSDSSFLYDAAIADLAGADAYYDGQTVQVTGEAVGEPIAVIGDDAHVWVMLLDRESGATVTVFMPRAAADRIDTFGKYGVTGSQVRVRGEYHLVCDEHDGESDLHAVAVEVVEPGVRHPDAFDPMEFAPGVAAVALGGVLCLAFWRMRERSR